MSFSEAKPDKTNSTYRHTIEWGFKNPTVGYSKKLGFNEPADKRIMLAGIIGRLFLKSLAEGAMCFKVAKRNHLADGTYKETVVCELYEDGWQLFGTFKNDTMLERFLQILFETQNVAAANSVFVGYNSMTFTGTTYQELIEQCSALKNYEPEEKVKRFFDHISKAKGWGKFAPVQGGVPPLAKKQRETLSIGSLIQNLRP